MKAIINSLIIAFSMYSKIPMPKVDWTKENMKYVMCFFPLIGVVLGGCVYLWGSLESVIPMSQVFLTVVMVLIPVIVTGGIHLDGLLDTADALSSYQTKERKLEILKDPHAGAFAIITCVGYFLLAFGIWYDVTPRALAVLAFGFVLSRALSGLAIVTFPLAKNSGLVTMFSNEAKKQVTRISMLLYIFLCAALMLWIDWKLGLICIFSALVVFSYYRYMSYKQFGGITGDLAGFFLQVCELVMAICVIVGGVVCG